MRRALLVLLTTALFTPILHAVLVRVTVTGTVTAGEDTSNVFGYGPGYIFSDERFTLICTFNDAYGTQTASSIAGVPDYSIDQGSTETGNSPVETATLTIGKGTWTWSVLPTSYRLGSIDRWSFPSPNTNMNLYVLENYEIGGSGPGSTLGSAQVSGTIWPARGYLTLDFDWRAAIPTVSTRPDRTMSFEINRIIRNTPVDYQKASGTLSPDDVTVDGPPCTLPIGEVTSFASFGTGGYQHAAGFVMKLTPLSDLLQEPFTGNSVSEVLTYQGDGCFDQLPKPHPTGAPNTYNVSRLGMWTVGTPDGQPCPVTSAGEYYGCDWLGYNPISVTYYQSASHDIMLPCHAQLSQQMTMQCGSSGPSYPFGTAQHGNPNTLNIYIDKSTIYSSRAGVVSNSQNF